METKPSQPELYLIAHKVRGEPAFDIAHRLMIGDEEAWLIPTSGHRAYPYDWFKLDELADVSDYPHRYPSAYGSEVPDDWDAWPDHYETTADKGRGLVPDLLSALGLPRAKPPTITRRI